MLVLEKQHGVIRSYCSAEQAARIERSSRHNDSPSGNGGEKRDSGLTMINGTAAQVTANGCPHYHRALPYVVRPPAQQGNFVMHLHVSGPNVVKELDLGNRFQPPGSHPHSASDYRCFRDWRIEHTGCAKRPLKVSGNLEYATFAFQPAQMFTPGNVGYVFAEHNNSGVSLHLLVETAIDQVDHSPFGAGEAGLCLGIKLAGGGVHVRRKHIKG